MSIFRSNVEIQQVTIFRDEEGVCRVTPAEVVVGPLESVIFTAENCDARITFPEEQPFGLLPPHKVVNPKTHEKRWLVTVRPDAPKGAVFEYTVYSDETHRYAVAKSLPQIRIKNG
jgi:hypothetical protein